MTILDALLTTAMFSLRDIHVATVDVTKAFDTVSHKAIMKTIQNLALPKAFSNYLTYTQAYAMTYLEMLGERSPDWRIGRGVRQGDPLPKLMIDNMLINLLTDRYNDRCLSLRR